MKQIHVGNVAIPIQNYAVSRSAVLGITNSGKTYLAKGIAEQLLDNDVPIVVFDAIGVWRHMKMPGDGSHAKGFKVVVAGGQSADLPLTVKSAPEIVRAAIRENISVIIDLYDPKLSKADWRRIVQDCFRILLYENTSLRHIFIEEAAEFAPQKVMDGQTYAEVEKLARMGGNASVGITFINQRSQELNKAVLDLCDNLFLLRQRGSHAISSLDKWMGQISPDTRKSISDSLPQLTQGQCWVWSEESEQPVRTKSGSIKSFHPDRKTPKAEIAKRASVEVGAFVSRLSTVLEKFIAESKEGDPSELKKRIRDLERQLSEKLSDKVEIKQVPFFSESERKELVDIQKAIAGEAIKTEEIFDKLMIRLSLIEQAALKHQPFIPAIQKWIKHPIQPQLRQSPKTERNGDSKTIGGGLRRMMIALAQRGGLNRRQLGVRAGMSSSSGTFGTYLATLRSNGWVTEDGDSFYLTDYGKESLGTYTELPSGAGLYNYWIGELGQGGITRILSALFDCHPKGLTREELGERAGISSSSGTFGTYLAKLRTLELIEGKTEIKASEEFFE